MKLGKTFKSILCCLVIISVAVFVCQGPAWAESLARQAVKAARIKQGNRALIKPAIKEKSLAGAVATAVNKAPAQLKPSSKLGSKGGSIANVLQRTVATKGNLATPIKPTTGGKSIAATLANAANKAPALPKSTPKMNLKEGRRIGGILGGVVGQTVKMPSASAVKAPQVPLMKGQAGKTQLNSPLTLKGVKKFK